MSTLTGVITETGQEVQIQLPTARIPELAEQPSALEGADEIAVYDKSENKTVRQTLTRVREYMETGGGSTGQPPVVIGGRYEIKVTAENMTGDDPARPNRVIYPALENKEFTLRRTGYGDILSEDYLVLPSGGFELKNGDYLRLGDIFVATEHSPATSTPGPTTPATSIFNDIALIVDDTILSSVHRYKLLHLAPDTKNITVTLEDIANMPPNSIIVLETALIGLYRAKVQTQAGQYIYFNSEQVQSMWLGTNEYLWLLRGTDGFYVLKASESITTVGRPGLDYVARANQIAGTGQLIFRSQEPRLVEWVLKNQAYVCTSESNWTGNPLYRGMFTLGTVQTGPSANIRIPDLQNQFFRALNNVGGSDTERAVNKAGFRQMDENKEHSHSVKDMGDQDATYDTDVDPAWFYANPGTGSVQGTAYVKKSGGVESRGRNIGLLGLINT